jgi:hypothetical protein
MSAEHEAERYAVFAHNFNRILNVKDDTFRFNEFADLTREEFLAFNPRRPAPTPKREPPAPPPAKQSSNNLPTQPSHPGWNGSSPAEIGLLHTPPGFETSQTTKLPGRTRFHPPHPFVYTIASDATGPRDAAAFAKRIHALIADLKPQMKAAAAAEDFLKAAEMKEKIARIEELALRRALALKEVNIAHAT